jgi:hypothetical protein
VPDNPRLKALLKGQRFQLAEVKEIITVALEEVAE